MYVQYVADNPNRWITVDSLVSLGGQDALGVMLAWVQLGSTEIQLLLTQLP